jgi:uncharacterized protein YraI
MRFGLITGVMLAALAVPTAARAHEAFIVSGGSLLAGPGPAYPPVADLSSGEPVQVYGCLDGYGWCDVSFQGYRGWFEGRQLAYPMNGVRVPLSGFGAELGVPVVTYNEPVRDRAGPGPHLPPAPTLQPRPRSAQQHETDRSGSESR